MKVREVMTPRADVVTAELPGTRDDVLEHLQDRDFSSVPIVKRDGDDEEFRGIVTREVLIKRPDEDQLALLVDEVPTTRGDADLSELCTLMVRESARRVPVVDGELYGIVTVTDVVREIANGVLDGEHTVGKVVRREVNCVYAETPLSVAERELSFAGVPYAVVLDDDGDLAGMLTEVDVLDVARVVEGEADTGESIADEDDDWAWEGIKAVGNRYMPTRNVELPDGPVSKFMTPDLVTIGTRRTVQDAAQLMIEHDIEQIPLVSGDELVGIVTDMSLLEAQE
jgi:IMP dehydrogenase